MALEIRHHKADNSHENIQFGRIATYWKQYFEYKEWDGLLIGNPEPLNDEYSRFRADAILLYEGGLLIFDLKDYKGTLHLPKSPDEFSNEEWYCDVEDGKIIVDGGSFKNPFRQLGTYRYEMKNIIESNTILKSTIKGNKVGTINLFSGPIELCGEIPGKYNRAYFIYDEDRLKDLVNNYNSVNKYSIEVAEALKKIFPTPEWEDNFEISISESKNERIFEIEDDLDSQLKEFLLKEDSGILVLESMESSKRDEWVEYLVAQAGACNIPQREIWTHSSRIKRKIAKRSRIKPDSLYNTIYGGRSRNTEDKDDVEEAEEDFVEGREIVSIKSDDFLDNSGLVILHEAHLVTRSLNQSDLLRFGSGRLLEDLIGFLNLKESNRKLICVGDPFSLSYGKEEESALALENLAELFEGDIRHYRAPFNREATSVKFFRTQLANSIDINLFNSLKYEFDNNQFFENDKAETLNLLREWFGKEVTSEPENAMLVYSNKDAYKINLWIKDKFLKNSKELAAGDLMLMSNNVSIPDKTGLGEISSLSNGMYLLVKEVKEKKTIPITSKNLPEPVNLNYTKIIVKCLSLDNHPEVEIWLLNNYFDGDDKLSREEEIALRILLGIKLKEYKGHYPFETSEENKKFLQDLNYVSLIEEIKILNDQLSRGEKVKTKLEEVERSLRKLERKYTRKYNQELTFRVTKEDPFLNALQAKYGWCITVHKAVGTQFKNICINASQGKESGYSNASYYRWLYTGITTSLHNVHVLNKAELDPLKDCQFHDIDEISTTGLSLVKKGKETFSFEEVGYPKWIEDTMDSSLGQNIKSAIFHFADKLNNVGVILDKVITSGEYLTKAHFSLPQLDADDLIMVFNNNGKGEVTSIRIEKNGEEYAAAIEEGIEYVKSQAGSTESTEEGPIPQDFRMHHYRNWIEKSASTGGNLQLVSTHSYDDVFLFSQGEQRVKFKVTFGNNGFFSTLRVLKKSDSLISKELYKMFFND